MKCAKSREKAQGQKILCTYELHPNANVQKFCICGITQKLPPKGLFLRREMCKDPKKKYAKQTFATVILELLLPRNSVNVT